MFVPSLRLAYARVSRAAMALAFVLLLGLANSASALNDYPRNDLWVTDGRVNAVARSADTIYIGGQFSSVAPYTGAGAIVDPDTGALSSSFPVIKGAVVRCAVSDGAGGWYLGGYFPAVDDFEIQHLVHVLPGGDVDSGFSFTFGGVEFGQGGVLAMDLSETGVLYICGQFSSVNGVARSSIAAIDTTTGTLGDWAPVLATFEQRAVLAVGNVVYVGEAGSLAAVDTQTGDVQALNSGNIGLPSALLLSGNILYIGGSSGLTAYDIDTDAPLAWNPAANGAVRTLLLSGGTIYAGGDFTNIGGQDRSFLAAVSTLTGNASSWNPAPDGFVSALAFGNDSIYVGGNFKNIGGVSRNGLAEVGITNDDISGFDPKLSRIGTLTGVFGIATALVFEGGELLVGGSFTGTGAVARSNIAALDAVTGAAMDWAPEADNLVNRLLLDGDTLYAAGPFTNIGGQPRASLAALDVNTDTNNATAFVANLNGVVRSAMKRHGDDLYLGGTFTTVNGETRKLLASVNATTGAVTAWDPSVTGANVEALDIVGDTVYVGGTFTEIGVSLRNHIGAVNDTTGIVTNFDPGATSGVSSLIAIDGKIYVSGGFNTIGGASRNRLAVLDGSTGLATDFVFDTNLTSPPTLANSGSILFLTNSFLNTLNGVSVTSPVAYDLASDTVLDWRPVANGSAVVAQGAYIYVLGGTTPFPGGPRINPEYFREYDLGADQNGIVVDFATAYATLTASLAQGVVDGDLDDDGRCDLDEFDCFADLLAAGDASGVPTVASTFLLNRAQMRRDLGDDFLSLVSGADVLFAAWLMLDDVAWVEGFLSGCGNCQREYSASSYDLSLNTAIETESTSCTIAPCAGNEGEGEGVADGEGAIDYDVCPGDSMQSQPPDRVTQFVEIRYSDANRNRIIYENFNDLTSDITGISWWGFGLDTNDGATECVRDPNEFLVSFYADGGGAPLNIVDSFTVTPVGEPAFAITGGPTVLRYSVTFNSPIPLSTGWVKIQGVNNTACDWAWYPSLDGDDLSVEEIVGASQTIVSFNPAICIAGVTPEGEGQVDGEGEGVVEGEGEGEGEGAVEGEGEGVTEGEGEGQMSDPYEELLYTFASADANGNSLVTLAEILVQLPKFTQEDFDAADANDDGSLSVAELLELSSAQVILSADTSGDYVVSLSELLRAVQLFNAGGYACAANPGASEDGYTPEEVPGLPACVLHGLDRNGDNQISLSELLRAIQIFSFAGYNYCDGQSEDDFCDRP